MATKRQLGRSVKQKAEAKIISASVSFIVNCLVLLILSLCVEKIHKTHTIKLDFNIKNDPEILNVEYKFQEPEETKHQASSSTQDFILPPTEEKVEVENLVVESLTSKEYSIPIKDLLPNNWKDTGIDSPSSVVRTVASKQNPRLFGGRGDSLLGMGNNRGSDNEFISRLNNKSAQTGDVQVSIMWDTYDDIDLWVDFIPIVGTGRHIINWSHRYNPISGGMLDVDCNVVPTTNVPVENIFWPIGKAPCGTYHIYVHHYQKWSNTKSVPVRLRVVVDGKEEYKKTVVYAGSRPSRVHSVYRSVKSLVPTSQ